MILYSSIGLENRHLTDFVKTKLGEKFDSALMANAVEDATDDFGLTAHVKALSNPDLLDLAAVKSLDSYDLVVIVGGNPFPLSHAGRGKRELFEPFLDSPDRLLIGISAGAMLLSDTVKYTADWNLLISEDNSDAFHDKDLTGYKFTNKLILPHYDVFCEENPEFANGIAALEKREHIEFFKLNNDETAYFNENGEAVLIK